MAACHHSLNTIRLYKEKSDYISRGSFPLFDARPLPTIACCASDDSIPRPKLLVDGDATSGGTPRPLPRAEGGGGLSTSVALIMAASIPPDVDLAMAAAIPVNSSFSSLDIASWRTYSSSSSSSELVSAAAGAAVDGAGSGYLTTSGSSLGGT